VSRVALVTAAFVAAVAVWGLSLPPRSTRLVSDWSDGTVRGLLHVHSRGSDGRGSLDEIAAAAARAGLRFLVVTDHGDGTRAPEPPSYRSGVLLLDAVEVSTRGGHYLALGLPKAPYPLGGEPADVVEDVRRLGGFGIAAHPDSAKGALQWRAWDARIDGIEWFNADSQWRDESRWRLLPTLLQYPLRPAETVVSLFDRPVSALRQWDELAARRRVVGFAAADAHARMGWRGKAEPYDESLYVRAPSYESVFRAFSMRAELRDPLTGDGVRDARLILDAVRGGRVYAAFDAVAGPAVLDFHAGSATARAWQGGWLPGGDGAVRFDARANLPPGGSLVLLRNGNQVAQATGQALAHDDTQPGAYRIEATVPGAPGSPPLPWIVSNPIYVGPAYAPATPEPPSAAPALASLELPSGIWRIEKDQGSTGTFANTGTPEGVIREFAFQLAGAGTSPFVALVTDEAGATHDATRLSFRARASRPLRLSVQARAANGATEPVRWQRSVYLDGTPREVTVAFADMRVAGTGERAALAPARISSILFVIDTTNARPGEGGRVWITRLRTER